MQFTAPIFIAGLDRSGTSLMFAFLASHPNISMVRRTNMFRYFYERYGDLSQPENFERCLGIMLKYKRLRHLQPDPERIRREFRQGEPTYGRLFTLFHQHNAERLGKPRWGDKSLHTERYADQIFKEFPNAKIIHMVRDPRDRYASAKKRYGRNRGRVGAATGRWLYSIRLASRNQRRYSSQYMMVSYEDLVSIPEEILRKICIFIGEEYSPDMLTMQGAPDHRGGGNSSFGKFEAGAVSTSSVGRFRRIMTPVEIAFMQAQANEAMQTYDYTPEMINLSIGDRLKYSLVDWPVNLLRMYSWIALEAIRDRRGRSLPARRMLPEGNLTNAPA